MIFESKLPRISVPNVNLVQFVLDECKSRTQATDPVFVDSESNECITVEQLEVLVHGLANGLRKCGINEGDVVATVAGNSIYYPFVAYGIIAAGKWAVCTPANPSYTPRELAHQLANAQCKAIVVGDGMLDVVMQALDLLECPIEHVWALDESRTNGPTSIFRMLTDSAPAFAPTHADSAAYLCYSSGTTGKPKGVILTHSNMIANAMQINGLKQLDIGTRSNMIANAMQMNGQINGQINAIKQLDIGTHVRETYLGLAPFCHAYGLSYVLHSSVSLGGRIIVMRTYSFPLFLQAIHAHRITFGYVVPPIVCALSKDARVADYDLSSMHTVLSGGAALSPTLIETAEERLGVRVIQGYGMSEMSPAVTMLSTVHKNAASVGILLPSCQAKVVDGEGRALGPNAHGELCFRGPNVMPAYYNNPLATRDIFDSAGFLHTGDIGYVDAAGFFYISDRKKEIIKYKGFQIAPSELESLLAEHPDIYDAAVMPVYDSSQATEIPRAYFVLKHRGASDQDRAQRIVEWLHERVAKYKRLRGGFVLIDHIPRSPAGKIIRASLKDIEHI
ncbi:hypothetical protein GGH96_002297 [Coemansia sp. RSA 1972]|nr:hypothetical protein GGH96_002297 [Coemansia sp. RSA 1972]